MWGSRRAAPIGVALLYMFTSSMQVPTQAAWMSFFSIPASARHSVKASTISSSPPMSQRSPKRVQPIPMIATLSLIPDAIARTSLQNYRTHSGQ